MANPPDDAHRADAQVDWNVVGAIARRRLARHMGGFSIEDLEDATQDCCKAYLTCIRRIGTPRSPEGLLFTIVRAVAADAVNDRQAERIAKRSPEFLARLYPDEDPYRVAVVAYERTVFLVREYFGLKRAKCMALADVKATKGSLKEYASSHELSHTQVLKEWSRCAQLIRDAVRSGRLQIPWNPPARQGRRHD